VHERGLVHRDLKPENLLVRTVEPLDLVLGDFGTVRAIDASVRWTRAWGTPQYSPPEFEGGEVSTAWDWWSFGMIVAEVTGGHHPFELPGGELLQDRQIRSAVAQRPVDLSDVSDPRARLLCQGLLTRDRHHRWGGLEVA
jgi:serine/threonine protein kinase